MPLLLRVLWFGGGLRTGLMAGLIAPWPATPLSPGARAVEAVRPAPRRCEATLYLPLADNQGRPFPEAQWQEALEVVVRPFGGATLGEPREGCWIDPARRLCREWVRPVVVSFA